MILLGEMERGEASYTQAVALFRELDDSPAVAAILTRFAVHAGHRGDRNEAERLIDEVRSTVEISSFAALHAQHLATLAQLAEHEDELEAAVELYRRSASVAAACGFRMWQMWQLAPISELSLRLGRVDDARCAAAEALRLALPVEDRRIIRLSFLGLAHAALAAGELSRAGVMWGWVSKEERDDPLLSGQSFYAEYVGELAAATDPTFVAASSLETGITLEEVVSVALDEGQ